MDAIAAECAPHSDISEQDLTDYVKAFQAALTSCGGPALEIGTRAGGSALAILRLIQELQPQQMLFTVDPYGQKPYPEGIVDKSEYIYGDDLYVQSKKLLAEFPNHAHFLMTGEEFVQRVIGTTYWRGGEEKPMTGFALAFLDGDHSKETLLKTYTGLLPHMAVDGLIVIDNADWSGNIVEELVREHAQLLLYNGRSCVLVKR